MRLEVPKTIYLWLAVILLCYLLPLFTGVHGKGEQITASAGLSSESFQKLVQAEIITSTALAPLLSSQRSQSLRNARASYRQLAVDAKGVGSARKLIILDKVAKKPFDASFVDKTLTANLKNAGIPEKEITAEVALWKSLYAPNAPPFKASELKEATTRIKAMRIGLLEDRALADLYLKAGLTGDAKPFEDRLDNKAGNRAGRILGLNGSLFLLGIIGFIALILFGVAWRQNNWPLVGRIATQPQRLSFGLLLDAFTFYIASVRVGGLVGGLVADKLPVDTVATIAVVYVLTGLLAFGYFAWRVRGLDASVRDIGLRSPGGFGKDLLYGLVGYGACLPLIAALGYLSHKLFAGNSSAAPNPVLPLLAGEQDGGLRLVLFLLVSIGAPLFEELFFRGVLYSSLRTRFDWPLAAVISAALFAMVHPPSDWLPIFGLGFGLAVVREMRQSLVPGMVMHFLQNGTAFLLMSVLFG